MNLEIIVCTESGNLEAMTKLLVFSIREFGGIISAVPIYSYKPRRGKGLSSSTIDFFEEYQVEFIDLELNKKYGEYPLANKPIVCAHREKETSADFLVFLDSDVFFLNSPAEIENVRERDLLLRPVDRKSAGGNTTFSDSNGDYWRKLYSLLGVNSIRETVTTIDNENILEYYNSGMIVTSVKNNLFSNWKRNFEKVILSGLQPHSGPFFIEQSVLSATISALELDVKLLNKYYNCPVHLLDQAQNQSYIVNDYQKIVNVHYHDLYSNENAQNLLFERLAKSEIGDVREVLNKIIN